jgi:hypothetical protein
MAARGVGVRTGLRCLACGARSSWTAGPWIEFKGSVNCDVVEGGGGSGRGADYIFIFTNL